VRHLRRLLDRHEKRIPGTLSPYRTDPAITRAPSSAPPASFGVDSSIPQMLLKNFVFKAELLRILEDDGGRVRRPADPGEVGALVLHGKKLGIRLDRLQVNVLVAQNLEPEFLRVLLAALDRSDTVGVVRVDEDDLGSTFLFQPSLRYLRPARRAEV